MARLAESDALSLVFAALADSTRRAMLARLAEGPATVKELAAPFEISLPAISKHLKVLEYAGLIERGREAQWRPAQLQAAPLKDVSDWLERYRKNWEESFDRLDEYLRKIQEEKSNDTGHTGQDKGELQ
jgi:DNA-binding transcriptional ArsR family regulator